MNDTTFCNTFDTLNEALEKISIEKCKNCSNFVYEDGMLTCKKTELYLKTE